MGIISYIARKVFEKGGTTRDDGLETPKDIARFDNITYGKAGEWNLLDVYRPCKHENGVVPRPMVQSITALPWHTRQAAFRPQNNERIYRYEACSYTTK